MAPLRVGTVLVLTILFAHDSFSEVVTSTLPQVGVESVGPVGSAISTTITVDMTSASTISEEQAAEAVLQAPVSVETDKGTVVAAKGDKLYEQGFDGQTAFRTADHVFFVDRNNDEAFEEVWVQPRFRGWKLTALSQPIPYSVNRPQPTTTVVPASVGDEQFQQELLYLGFSKGTLRLQYREFKNRYARDAFYQDLAYDIESFPATVTFRTMQIEILGADNNQIRYRLLSELSN